MRLWIYTFQQISYQMQFLEVILDHTLLLTCFTSFLVFLSCLFYTDAMPVCLLKLHESLIILCISQKKMAQMLDCKTRSCKKINYKNFTPTAADYSCIVCIKPTICSLLYVTGQSVKQWIKQAVGTVYETKVQDVQSLN